MELLEEMPFLEWMANNYKNFGANLEIITDRSQEGSQFVKGFGGIGGILRYKVDFQNTFKCDEFEDSNIILCQELTCTGHHCCGASLSLLSDCFPTFKAITQEKLSTTSALSKLTQR